MRSMAIPWRRVSQRHPCPICRKPDWCTVAPDGEVCCCMRVESDHVLRNGGWLHRLKDQPLSPVLLPPPRRLWQEPVADFTLMHHAWQVTTSQDAVSAHAEALGVSRQSLCRLGIAWAPQHRAWAFPMRDDAGAIVGIRLRAEDGRKWAVRGSRAGLIYDPGFQGDPPLLICEGPTDTAAAMTLGFAAVGRPSCRGQEDLLRRLLKRKWHWDVVIVADNDAPKDNGARPGLAGAVDLGRELRRPVRVVLPPGKDIRQWLRSGCMRQDIETAVNNAAWVNVR